MRRFLAALLMCGFVMGQGRPGGGPPEGFMGMRGPSTPAEAFERTLKQNRLGTWLVLEDDAVTFGTAARAALEEDPLVDLNLPLLVAGGKTPTAQSTYLRERFGWSRGGHWALLDSSGSVLGEGATAPTPASLSAAADRAGVKSRAQELEAFLLLHGDHLEAQVALVRERINVACRRTRKVLGLAQPKATGPARPGANPSPVAAPPPPTAAAAAALPPEEPKPLDPELDQKVWGEAARLFGKLFQGPWQEAYSDLPMALNGPESVHSPAMQEAWTRCLPAIEEALRRQPSDEDLWRIWVIGSDLSGGRPLAPFMDSLAPLPGTAPEEWPPESVLGAFVRDARKRADWRAIKDALEPRWDEFRRDNRRAAIGAQPGERMWNRVLQSLVEALLQGGEAGAADQLVLQAIGVLRWDGLALRARDLATRLDRPDLALRWGALGSSQSQSR